MHRDAKITCWIVVLVFALCITSTLTVNQTDSPSNIFNDGATEEPPLLSTPTKTNSPSTTVEDLQSVSPFTEEPMLSTPTRSNLTNTSSEEPRTDSPSSVNATSEPIDVSFSPSSNTPTLTTTETLSTGEAPVVREECPCNITPFFCDIGCCCDNVDCGIENLTTVFNCQKDTRPAGVCVERWLMFRANIDPKLITLTDTLFCVREEVPNEGQAVRSMSGGWQYEMAPSFNQDGKTTQPSVKDFYQVDDLIFVQYSRTSLLSTLKQPSPGFSSSQCADLNPARFMRSTSHSCARVLNAQSCLTDSWFNILFYFQDISLLRVPSPGQVEMSDLLIPIVGNSSWPQPSKVNDDCLNVVSKVEYVIKFTSGGEIVSATLNADFINTPVDSSIMQQFSIVFQLATVGPTPLPHPAIGISSGNPVIGRFDNDIQRLTILPATLDCTTPPPDRVPIRFLHNSISGCSFRSRTQNCSELRSELYRVLVGMTTPDGVAMSASREPDWADVITEECSDEPTKDLCSAGCEVPISVSIQFLWAKMGLLSLPQKYILGAKYKFVCKKLKCPLIASLAIAMEVTFSEVTKYPQPPRGMPLPHWKFPYSFFTGGKGELDAGS